MFLPAFPIDHEGPASHVDAAAHFQATIDRVTKWAPVNVIDQYKQLAGLAS